MPDSGTSTTFERTNIHHTTMAGVGPASFKAVKQPRNATAFGLVPSFDRLRQLGFAAIPRSGLASGCPHIFVRSGQTSGKA